MANFEKHLDAVEKYRPLMEEALDWLWKNPEPGFREWKSSAYLAAAYEKLGYKLNYAGEIPGFYADLDTGLPGPTVVVFAELDSLIVRTHPECDKETGAVHACGHCAQGAALLGVAAAAKEEGVLDGLCGKIRFCIVPAEEIIEMEFREELRKKGIIKYYGGKPEFMRRGYLDGCDLGLNMHTGGGSHIFSMKKGYNGNIAKNITFKGKSAHAGGSPSAGINALYAANTALSAANALRETFRDSEHVRWHPIITSGGTVPNAIPEMCHIESNVRGATVDVIKKTNYKINRVCAASAAALGANVLISDRPGYLPFINDVKFARLCEEAIAGFIPAENIRFHYDEWDAGCTDMGDVSTIMPIVQLFCSGAKGVGHSCDYYIADKESAVYDSAKAQLLILNKLLESGAAGAKQVIENKNCLFKNKEEYFAFWDSLTIDKEAVIYNENGTVTLDF